MPREKTQPSKKHQETVLRTDRTAHTTISGEPHIGIKIIDKHIIPTTRDKYELYEYS